MHLLMLLLIRPFNISTIKLLSPSLAMLFFQRFQLVSKQMPVILLCILKAVYPNWIVFSSSSPDYTQNANHHSVANDIPSVSISSLIWNWNSLKKRRKIKIKRRKRQEEWLFSSRTFIIHAFSCKIIIKRPIACHCHWSFWWSYNG